MSVIHKLEMFHMAVSDVAKSKEFYADILGCKVLEDKEYGGQRWVSLELPGGGTSINMTNVHENMVPGTYKLYFSVQDIEAAREELASKNVKPTKEGDDWGRWENSDGKGQKYFTLADPDGNQLLIIPAK